MEPTAGAPFARLRTLVMNASGGTWQQVCKRTPPPCTRHVLTTVFA
jgi:hypothetical protein